MTEAEVPLWRVFARAFVQVALVAANTRFVAAGAASTAFATGFVLSWVWWGNTRSAAHHEHPWARAVYGLGAACGTVAGMTAASFWR